MATRQYIGARYVPIFADPVEWDNERTYEPLTMVQHLGETYMSRQYVPVGAPLPDSSQEEESTDYWVHMSNWNAQVEAYRQEVLQYNGRISTLEGDLPLSAFDAEHTVDDRFDAIEANNWVTTDRISDGAVTSSKILDGTIATADIADDAVTNAKIADNAVDTDQIASEAVTSAKIANGTIEYGDLNTSLKNQVIYNGDVVFIGDSITYGYGLDSTTDRWSNKICNMNNWNGHSYAVSGTGFTLGSASSTFYGQAQTAAADTSFENNSVKYVFVAGGINDGQATSSQLANAFDQLNNYLVSTFTNAKIVYILGLCAATPMDSITAGSGRLPRWEAVRVLNNQAQTSAKALVCPKPYLWLMGVPAYAIDTVHPNANGHSVIANNVNNFVHGYGVTLNQYADSSMITVNTDYVASTTIEVFCVDDMIHIEGNFTLVSGALSIAGTKTLLTLPDMALHSRLYTSLGVVSGTNVNDGVKYMSLLLNSHTSTIQNWGDYSLQAGDSRTFYINITIPRGI